MVSIRERQMWSFVWSQLVLRGLKYNNYFPPWQTDLNFGLLLLFMKGLFNFKCIFACFLSLHIHGPKAEGQEKKVLYVLLKSPYSERFPGQIVGPSNLPFSWILGDFDSYSSTFILSCVCYKKKCFLNFGKNI